MPFTVTDVPHLTAGFADTFTSHTVKTSDLTLHAVVGGDGPPLLLLPAWPQFWYHWRLVMPALAEHFTVVAADVRGLGGSDKPATGYTSTNAWSPDARRPTSATSSPPRPPRPDAIPQHIVDVYVDLLRNPAALHAVFEYYRTLDEWPEQVRWRDEGPLSIPVLAIGGEYATGTGPEEVMRLLATDVTGLVIPGVGHFLAEEAPEALTKALLDFLL
ncbi:alpha/beta fold hydrolase [Streptomyces mirabilis]|uniref:alpha/beta fold hydrolase n=1 Tax=Streptomyces mirabilis TaxID=68239 RepID=UPI00339F9B93